MSAKEVKFGVDARDRMLRGISGKITDGRIPIDREGLVRKVVDKDVAVGGSVRRRHILGQECVARRLSEQGFQIQPA